MQKRNTLHIIIFFCAALCFLADKVSIPAHLPFVKKKNELSYAAAKDKVLKPYTGISKIKLKVRYKAGEIKFTLAGFIFHDKVIFHCLKQFFPNTSFFLNEGFNFLVKLRGPPAINI